MTLFETYCPHCHHAICIYVDVGTGPEPVTLEPGVAKAKVENPLAPLFADLRKDFSPSQTANNTKPQETTQ